MSCNRDLNFYFKSYFNFEGLSNRKFQLCFISKSGKLSIASAQSLILLNKLFVWFCLADGESAFHNLWHV